MNDAPEDMNDGEYSRSMGSPLAPDTVLPARLEAREWNIVLDALQNASYRLVAPIIERLHRQLVNRE